MIWSKVPNQFSQPATKTLDRNSACVCLWVCIQLRSLCMFELLSIFSFLARWQLWHGLLASCWGIPPDLLTFRIIASCFNCHGSWGSEVRVNLSCCALGYKCRHTWSLDHSSPAYYSLQTIRFLSLLHSSTCRSWKKKVVFQLCSLSPSTLHWKQRVFKWLVFESLLCEAWTQSTTSTMSLLQC